MTTKIEWATHVWNPVTGCSKVSQGCKNCYAEKMHKRLEAMGQEKYLQPFSKVTCHNDVVLEPLSWGKKPRRVFVNSMSDLFHEDVPFDFIDTVFTVMAQCQKHTFMILTKRPERMAKYFNERSAQTADEFTKKFKGVSFECLSTNWPLPNVWLGTSVEDQEAANERILHLLHCPAAVRFLSCEPLLGPVDLFRVHTQNQYGDNFYHNVLSGITHMQGFGNTYFENTIHWVIAGGESGHKARPLHPQWLIDLRNQCINANVPFFFKQWGEFYPCELAFHSYLNWQQKAQSRLKGWRRGKDICIDFKGTNCTHGAIFKDAIYPVQPMFRIGKKNSGRFLDGAYHNEFPKGGEK